MKKKKKQEIVWDKNGSSIFEQFAVDFQEFYQTGALPGYADQDMQYCLELQQQRLKKLNLDLQYDFTPRGHFASHGGLSRSWSDDRYCSAMEYRTCKLKRSIFQNEKRIYNKSQNRIFYEIITNVHNQELVGNDPHTCPNCGSVSKIIELQDGCRYCGTVFKMRDFFPKVTNYYHIKDYGGTNDEVKMDIKKFILIWIVIFIIGNTISALKDPSAGGELVLSLIPRIFVSVIGGAIVGYFTWAMQFIGSLFKEAGKSIGMLVNIGGSEKRFTKAMKNYSPEFSYEYFSSRAVSLLRMILFAEQPDELAIYHGEPIGTGYANIVDTSYRAATALKQFRVENDICTVVVEIYMEDLLYDGKRIQKKSHVYRMRLQKNMRNAFNMGFSVKAIQCHSCGRSFDATKEKRCPNCETVYLSGQDDWMVTSLWRR